MSDRTRKRFLLGWAVMVASAGVAACDSPIVAPYSTEGSRALVAAPVTEVAVADSDTTRFYATCGEIWNDCPTTDSVTVGEPGGNVKIGRFGPQWTEPVTVGGNTYGFQLGVVSASFIGVIWKDGAFAGYWGYCLFPKAWNDWYKTTDPVTGKVYIHWENHELDSNRKDTGQMYHYIYDPATNTLKVYHRDRNGNTKLVYQGPPIKTHSKLPPPDPAGANPYTNENQWTTGVPVPATPAGTTTPPGTTTPGTETPGTATPGTATPESTSGTMSAGMAAAAEHGHHGSSGGGVRVVAP